LNDNKNSLNDNNIIKQNLSDNKDSLNYINQNLNQNINENKENEEDLISNSNLLIKINNLNNKN
jgi:hypothetical protein